MADIETNYIDDLIAENAALRDRAEAAERKVEGATKVSEFLARRLREAIEREPGVDVPAAWVLGRVEQVLATLTEDAKQDDEG